MVIGLIDLFVILKIDKQKHYLYTLYIPSCSLLFVSLTSRRRQGAPASPCPLLLWTHGQTQAERTVFSRAWRSRRWTMPSPGRGCRVARQWQTPYVSYHRPRCLRGKILVGWNPSQTVKKPIKIKIYLLIVKRMFKYSIFRI